MHPFPAISRGLDGQRNQLFPWVPVAIGAGGGLYFSLHSEPGPPVWSGRVVLSMGLVMWLCRLGQRAPLLIALALAIAGFAIAAAPTRWVAAPVLEFRNCGPNTGRLVAIDRSVSDKPRITPDRVILDDVRPERMPKRVRISLRGDHRFNDPEPGLTVMTTGHLAPPQGLVEPGGPGSPPAGLDSAAGGGGLHAQPGAGLEPDRRGPGRALGPPHPERRRRPCARGPARPDRGVFRGDHGGGPFGHGSGDDGGVADLEPRASSGDLGDAYGNADRVRLRGGAVRVGGPTFVALPWPLHRIGEGAALAARAGYLALSGGNLATERAFIMVAVMLLAVRIDRRALTPRAVAWPP